jgi:putative addiction module killer protein
MFEIRQTETFKSWLVGLKDQNAKARIVARIRRLSLGNPGDVKPVGNGVSELRIDYGPGYRVYYVRKETIVILLLCGGTKNGQNSDIKEALRLAEEVD